MDQQVIQHRPPWKVEYDRTREVIASDGYCIAKCGDPAAAKSLVVWAEWNRKNLTKFAEENEREYSG